MSLKELTKQAHADAEQTGFAKLLLSGDITEKQYAQYLLQMLEVYMALEYCAVEQGLLDGLPDIGRTPKIARDFEELGFNPRELKVLDSTKKYIKYLIDLSNDPERKNQIMAHLYVRHMGDLYGGQVIKKKVPGSGAFYEFKNRKNLIDKIREKLSDDLGDEANVAFEHAINIMKELDEWCVEHSN